MWRRNQPAPALTFIQIGAPPVATYSSRTVTVVRHEWVVPAAEPWGSDWVQVFRAFHEAEREYRRLHGLPYNPAEGVRLPDLSDDAIRLHVGDDEIVWRFETSSEDEIPPAPTSMIYPGVLS